MKNYRLIIFLTAGLMMPFSVSEADASAGTVLVGADYYGELPDEGNPDNNSSGNSFSVSDTQNSGNNSTGNSFSDGDDSGTRQYAGTTGTDSTDGTNANTENEEDWCLILVNKDHPIPDGYEIPELTTLSDGHRIDSRIYPALQQMFDDARSQGVYPGITSAYRTFEEQQEQMDIKAAEYTASGYSQEDAYAMAEEWVAIPGTSEHQLGLCLDISSFEQDPGAVWYWLDQNAHLYGFIQRYPESKTDITGINNEPWHYRYVGLRAAKEMKESGMCLEEYLSATQTR